MIIELLTDQANQIERCLTKFVKQRYERLAKIT